MKFLLNLIHSVWLVTLLAVFTFALPTHTTRPFAHVVSHAGERLLRGSLTQMTSSRPANNPRLSLYLWKSSGTTNCTSNENEADTICLRSNS
jgi:hypothetical protein